jgi:hypothetical protein
MVVTSHLKSNHPFSSTDNKPLQYAGVFCFIAVFFLASCSSFIIPLKSGKKSNLGSGYQQMTAQDYEDHLAALKDPFLKGPGVVTVKEREASRKYIINVLNDIIANNEIFFKKLKSANVTILNSESPMYFSLPKGEIFLSSGLLTKYIKNESMLVCVLAYELVRSEKILYPRQIIVPTGFVSLERMLNLNRLSLDEKMEVHKWAHHLTIRSGYDGEYYLSWLQTQNRNTADFILQVGDANQINREESLFKAFLIKNTNEDEQVTTKKTSSKNFYTFINSIREVI